MGTLLLMAAGVWVGVAWTGVVPDVASAQAPIPGSASYIEVTFLDVGHGDAIVVRSPDGATLMVDAGAESPLRPIARLGVDSLSLLVASHAHRDHIGGMDAVLTARPIARFLDDGAPPETAVHERLHSTLRRIPSVRRLEASDTTLRVGDLTIEVLPPTDALQGSVGLVVRYDDFSVLLPGDAQREQLTHWLESGRLPDVTVLKASDHGSVAGFTHAFVAAANPEAVVISVGTSGRGDRPRAEALTAYRQHSEHLFRTDVDGHVTIHGFADGTYEVLTGKDIDDRRPRIAAAAGHAPSDDSAPGGDSSTLALRVVVDEPGTREGDLNGEYAVVVNRGVERLDLSGWRLCDLSTRCFRFPPGTSVPPSREVAVYTGYGYSDGVSFFMNNDRRVWNQNGDEATLYDADGRTRARYVY